MSRSAVGPAAEVKEVLILEEIDLLLKVDPMAVMADVVVTLFLRVTPNFGPYYISNIESIS